MGLGLEVPGTAGHGQPQRIGGGSKKSKRLRKGSQRGGRFPVSRHGAGLRWISYLKTEIPCAIAIQGSSIKREIPTPERAP